MTELMRTVAMPFRKRGKTVLMVSEFIFALSLDLGWFSPEQAKRVLQVAKEAGLVAVKGDEISPNFDAATVEIPLGFKPELSQLKEQPLFDRIIDLIMTTGVSRKEAIALVNEKQERLQLMIEVTALLVAKERGVDISHLADEAYGTLIATSSQPA
ncbi:MAG: DUF2240 family protein [Methanosarcinales archaeon]|nr:MAG: DUF2240 family protein [Methanosarcinales archaeon]